MQQLIHRLLPLFALLTCSLHTQAQQLPDALESIHIRSIGPAAMSGRITAIAVDPNAGNTIYAGAASGGIWRSTSGGTKWEPIFDNAPTQAIGSLAINPRNSDEIWVGTGEGNPRNSQNFGVGIFKTIDGGKTWANMGLEKTRTIHRVILHRDNANIVWAASLGSAYGPNDERGVFKSTDGGKSWRKVLFINDLTGCAELIVDPNNPNKLIAAMWEYRRWPWFFKSGGKGSGIYISYDAGETWERRTDKDGLPEGELGRCGLAIAPSNSDIVYALVEAKENALYKSTDGGRKWRKMADKNQGERPFYYSEIYVDPKNENKLYSIASQITRSIDGGRTFDGWVNYWRIHPDHHAFWIDPKDGQHIINGNDGGLNITFDGGATWRYAENIPVGQFYHVNVDNERPYNLYGGLQDNGSWVGPSAVWKASGMRNAEWQEVYFGDGFDVVPQRDNPRYMFAMSQGGNIGYIDRETGKTRECQPLHPEGKDLRWNWNSGVAQDPFADHGLYFGSNYLHYSPDLGVTWQLISPDLTTADTAKMHPELSGGLTLDATNAENHCTIIAVAPSPAQQGVVWVGTDDGNIQLTRDGGKTWTNTALNIKNLPKGAWIPQIEVSAKNAGEAFVVVNNYRQNDWDPYLYHTRDFGATWNRLANASNVTGFCLSVVQDPVTPNLLFLGTDQGLHYSLDYGQTWTHFPNPGMNTKSKGILATLFGSNINTPAPDSKGAAFPCVPVQDMKIHPRDGDLVIGTFGRAFWILDNLAPLRSLAKQPDLLTKSTLKLFEPQEAILANYASYQGPRFVANETFVGENKPTHARIPVWRKQPEKKADKPDDKKKDTKEQAEDKKKADKKDVKEQPVDKKGNPEGPKTDKPKGGGGSKEKATIVIFNMQGDTIRRFKTEVDTGFSHINWYLDTRGVRMPSNNEPDKEQLEAGNGPTALPGTYKVKVIMGDQIDSVLLNVIDDPRVPVKMADREQHFASVREFQRTIEQASKAYDRLKNAEKTIKLVEDSWVNVPDSLKKDALKLGSALKDSISAYKSLFFAQKEGKGIQRDPDDLNAKLYRALGYISNDDGAPGQQAQIAIGEAQKAVSILLIKINALMDNQWKAYREKAGQVQFSLFKE